MNTCEHNREMMMRRLDGAINPAEERGLAAHLRECPDCARENGLLIAADGLLRAVGAPAVAEAEWPPVAALMAREMDGWSEVMARSAAASEPPAVTGEEWGQVWGNIERESLLDEEKSAPIKIRRPARKHASYKPASRKRTRWYEIMVGAAAAVLLAVGGYVVVMNMFPRERQGRPFAKDTVQVGRGYAYTALDTGSDEPVYVVTMVADIDHSTARPGSGYVYSEPAGRDVIEVAPANSIEHDGGNKPIIIPAPSEG